MDAMDASPASPDLSVRKQAIRIAMRDRLASITPEDRAARSKLICAGLLRHTSFANASTVMLYMPMRSEVDVIAVALEAFRLGKVVCLPRVDPGRDTMNAIATTTFDNDSMRPDAMGVRSPEDGPRVPDASIDLVVVPGVAFDLAGKRLGRGGGFYDRFLSHLPTSTATIGVCFDWQIVDSIPADHRDMSVQAVITDHRAASSSQSQRPN
ncbi:MAG: 5-formyltetrahydrofolate cyclo-ligase [Phycisphaerales bacterium]|nr:5-formyltetrahydrofolate cyclo-ligase [Phycisphaerales bacterium]